jgi:hypothetical protein
MSTEAQLSFPRFVYFIIFNKIIPTMKKLVFFLMLFAPAAVYSQKTGCTDGDCQNGKGTYVYTNGYSFEGTFVNGKREGRGKLIDSEGGWYDGMWANDQFNGQGTYIWPNGTKYIGAWKDGVQEGYGIYFYSNGDKYTGYFKNNKFNGEGTYTWADGSTETGVFKDGERLKTR